MSLQTTVQQDLALAATLKRLGDDTLIDVSSLAALLCLTPASARQAAYRNPEGFPPRFPTPSRHLRWRLGDVREWIRRRAMLLRNLDAPQNPPVDHQLGRPNLEKTRTAGRPRKAEQVRLQKLGERLKRERSAAGSAGDPTL